MTGSVVLPPQGACNDDPAHHRSHRPASSVLVSPRRQPHRTAGLHQARGDRASRLPSFWSRSCSASTDSRRVSAPPGSKGEPTTADWPTRTPSPSACNAPARSSPPRRSSRRRARSVRNQPTRVPSKNSASAAPSLIADPTHSSSIPLLVTRADGAAREGELVVPARCAAAPAARRGRINPGQDDRLAALNTSRGRSRTTASPNPRSNTSKSKRETSGLGPPASAMSPTRV